MAHETTEGFKLEHDHRDGCYAAQAEDGIAFVMPEGRRWDLDRIGRKGGSTLWFLFRCNDTECPATLLVRWDVLARFINRVDA